MHTKQPIDVSGLSAADRFHLEAAEGWLMLGNPLEADQEMDNISLASRRTPGVLAMRYQVYAAANWWEAAWIISEALCDALPDSPEVWICQANTLRQYQKGKCEAAADLLQRMQKKFPENPVISYNLACFFAQINRFEDAGRELVEAFKKDNGITLKVAAVHDPDLKPLWEQIGGVPKEME